MIIIIIIFIIIILLLLLSLLNLVGNARKAHRLGLGHDMLTTRS